ncbi:hypothetical protein BGZ54_005735, partial [Gamsiella multidivaricata]
ALNLANAHLENARKADDPYLILDLCASAEAALSQMKRADKRTLIPPMSTEDQALCNGISTAYSDRGKLLDSLGHLDKAQASFRQAEKWRYVLDPNGNPIRSRSGAIFTSIRRALNLRGTSTAAPERSYPEAKSKLSRSDVAQVPPAIFPENVARPATKHDLPGPDGRITTTPQLAYCLGLLSKASASSSLTYASEPDEPLDKA